MFQLLCSKPQTSIEKELRRAIHDTNLPRDVFDVVLQYVGNGTNKIDIPAILYWVIDLQVVSYVVPKVHMHETEVSLCVLYHDDLHICRCHVTVFRGNIDKVGIFDHRTVASFEEKMSKDERAQYFDEISQFALQAGVKVTNSSWFWKKKTFKITQNTHPDTRLQQFAITDTTDTGYLLAQLNL